MAKREMYLYLDLNGRLDTSYFTKDNIFFKIIDVATKKPFVQIGNHVFEGKYEEIFGDKVFFCESQNNEQDEGNIFAKQSLIRLRYLAKTAKVMRLNVKQVPTKNNVNENGNERIELQFKEGYNAVLDKFEKGLLNISDIAGTIINQHIEEINISKNVDKNVEEKMEIDKVDKRGDTEDIATLKCADKKLEEMEVDKVVENTTHPAENNFMDLVTEYILLPFNQSKDKIFETRKETLKNVDSPEDYPVLRQLFLQEILLDDVNVNLNNLTKYVNVKKSVRDGKIEDIPIDQLNDDHLKVLLSGDNFENFTLLMKTVYLMAQLEHYKKFIKDKKNENKLNTKDAYGRTIKDKYWLLKGLVKYLWNFIYTNKIT